MFSNLLNRVEAQLEKELPFVVYRKPNSDRVRAILQKDDQVHYIGDFTEKGFVFAPFDGNDSSILMPLDGQLEAKYPQGIATNVQNQDFFESDGFKKGFHIELVQKGMAQIEAGLLDKVVLSRKMEVEYSGFPVHLFEKLLALYASAFCYLWYHPKIGLWLGATPEILLRTENNRLTTMSLAGTQTYKGDENPVWGQKELLEQQMVTDYIANALKDEVPGLQISGIQSVKAGNLWHLRTKLTGIFKNDLSKIVKVLHPTPAICGMPLENAKSFVLHNENYDREYYTGFLGELNLKQEIDRAKGNRNQENKSYRAIKTITELFVNLRCMQLKKNKAIIYVGGGITKASDPEREWEETVVKSKTMLDIISK